MKLGDLTKAEIPFRDRPMSVFNLGDWWGLILGAVVFMIVVALAKPVHDFVSGLIGRVPIIGTGLQGHIAPIVPTPTPAQQPIQHPGLRALQ